MSRGHGIVSKQIPRRAYYWVPGIYYWPPFKKWGGLLLGSLHYILKILKGPRAGLGQVTNSASSALFGDKGMLFFVILSAAVLSPEGTMRRNSRYCEYKRVGVKNGQNLNATCNLRYGGVWKSTVSNRRGRMGSSDPGQCQLRIDKSVCCSIVGISFYCSSKVCININLDFINLGLIFYQPSSRHSTLSSVLKGGSMSCLICLWCAAAPQIFPFDYNRKTIV